VVVDRDHASHPPNSPIHDGNQTLAIDLAVQRDDAIVDSHLQGLRVDPQVVPQYVVADLPQDFGIRA
jgi:hypothetical protein